MPEITQSPPIRGAYQISWRLKMEPKGCPEMSARNYHYTLRNKPEDRRSQIFIECLNPSPGSRTVTFRPKGTQMDRQMDTTKIAFCNCVNPLNCAQSRPVRPYLNITDSLYSPPWIFRSSLSFNRRRCFGRRWMHSIYRRHYIVKVKQSRYSPGVAQSVPRS